MLGLMLMVLAADAAPLKDAEGATWKTESKTEMLGGGMASRRVFKIFRNGKEVATVEGGSFHQENPRISGGTEWKFEIVAGVFEARGTAVRFEKDKRTESVTVLRWNGKGLFPAAP